MSIRGKYVLARALGVVAVGAGLAIPGSSQRAVADHTGECCLSHTASCCITRDEYRIECETSPTGCCFATIVEDPDYTGYSCHHLEGYDTIPAPAADVTCLMKVPKCSQISPTGCAVEDEAEPFDCESWNALTGNYNCP
jgi:hypothetical protein